MVKRKRRAKVPTELFLPTKGSGFWKGKEMRVFFEDDQLILETHEPPYRIAFPFEVAKELARLITVHCAVRLRHVR